MFQSGIETRLTLSQSDFLQQSYRHSQRRRRNFLRIYFYIYPIGYWSVQFMRTLAVTQIHTLTHIHAHIHFQKFIELNIFVLRLRRLYIYTHTHTHTHTHTCTLTQAYSHTFCIFIHTRISVRELSIFVLCFDCWS